MRGSSLDRKVKTDDEESGSSALTMRAPPVQIDKAFLEGKALWVGDVDGLAGITGKQPVKLNLNGKLTTEGAREKLIEFCASDKVQLVVYLYLGDNSLGDLDAAALTALFTALANLIDLKTLDLNNSSATSAPPPSPRCSPPSPTSSTSRPSTSSTTTPSARTSTPPPRRPSPPSSPSSTPSPASTSTTTPSASPPSSPSSTSSASTTRTRSR